MSDTPVQTPSTPSERVIFLRGVIGALVGAVLGYWLYYVFLRRGFILIPMPGATIGICRELATRHRSVTLAIVCVALALAVQGYVVHATFGAGLYALEGMTIAAFIAGLVFAFWFGIGRVARASVERKE